MAYDYKCKECGKKYEAQESFCSDCNKEGTIVPIGVGGIEKYKKYWWIALVLIIIIFLLIRCPGDPPTVNVVYNQESQRLTVDLDGKKVMTDNECNYVINIKRNGDPFGEPTNKRKFDRTFDVPGKYTIEVKWIGKTRAPEIKWNGPHFFEIYEKTIPPQAPEISGINILSIDYKIKKYKISISIKADSFLVAEYSIDGQTYQKTNVFSNISPGDYTFYARNEKDKSSEPSSFPYPLPEIVSKPSPSDAVLNDLLRKMAAKGDKNAFKQWRDSVEEGLPPIDVTGVANISNSYELVQDALQGKSYTVSTQRDANQKIINITVK